MLDGKDEWDDLIFNEEAWKRFDTLKGGNSGIWKIVCTSGKILNKM